MAMTLDGSAGVTYPVVAGASSAVQASSAKVIQVVNVQTSTLASSTVAIPGDNTIPQNTEGTELFTLAITPTSATSKLLIQVNALCGISSTAQWATLALFQDSTANALAAVTSFQTTAGSAITVPLTYFMTAGTTSSTTFKVRFGLQTTSTMYINGANGARLYGGADATTMTIMEIAA
jgi:hypothetical protein